MPRMVPLKMTLSPSLVRPLLAAILHSGNIERSTRKSSQSLTQTHTIVVGATANSSDSGNGGSSTVGAYQINVGLDTSVGGTGWGAGTWSRDGWGDAASGGLTTTNQIRLWSHDNFGEDLLINPRDGGIYWDRTNNLSTRAVETSTLSGTKTSIPTIAKQVLVSDQDRHVIAFG